MYFYDGLLLLFPAIVWHVSRADYVSAFCHRLIGTCILLVFVTGHVTIFLFAPRVAWTGPMIAVWLLAEASDLLASRSTAGLAAVHGPCCPRRENR